MSLAGPRAPSREGVAAGEKGTPSASLSHVLGVGYYHTQTGTNPPSLVWSKHRWSQPLLVPTRPTLLDTPAGGRHIRPFPVCFLSPRNQRLCGSPSHRTHFRAWSHHPIERGSGAVSLPSAPPARASCLFFRPWRLPEHSRDWIETSPALALDVAGHRRFWPST
jgi:hypothetical protein